MSVSSSAGISGSDSPAGVVAHHDVRGGIARLTSIAAAFAIALAILSLGITAPFEKDAESQSAQWVVDIAHHGNWLLPHDYYGLVERKPPLFYWLGAIGVKVSGGNVDEARARMPSLIAGAAVATLMMDWAAADLGAAAGWLAFFFLIGTYGFAARATVALTDMLMTFFLMAVWRVVRPLLDGESSSMRTAGAGLILGLGILVKGPVIVVLIALAAILYLAAGRSNPLRLATCIWPWLLLLTALAVAAAWYVPAFIAGRSDAWGGVFVDENFGHFLPAKMGGTGEAARPFYYIVARLLGGTMPLSFLLPALILAFAVSAFPPLAAPAMRYQIAMVAAVIVLFSASSAKRDDYILPAIPPLAVLFATLFSRALDSLGTATSAPGAISSRARNLSRVRIVRDLASALIASAMLFGVAATALYVRMSDHADELGAHLQSSDASFAAIFLTGMKHLPPPFVAFVTAVVIGAIVIASALLRRSSLRTGTGVAILCLAGSMLWTGVLKPQETWTRSLSPFAGEVKERVGQTPLYLAFMDPEFVWYYGDGVPVMSRPMARTGPPPGTNIFLVSRPNELVRFSAPIRDALILVLPSSALGANPPSLYLLGSVETDRPIPHTDLPTQHLLPPAEH
jgi:4-amino-4-deoxy-L-arabinose transferase-like glycosyltransferase